MIPKKNKKFQKKIKNNKINWICNSDQSWLRVKNPMPAKKYIPDWYKKIPNHTGGRQKIKYNADGSWESNATLKKCIPFLDSYMLGYIQELWCDIHFYKKDNGSIGYDFYGDIDPLGERPGPHHINNSDMWENKEFFWKTQWEPKTPEGISSLYVHPLNRPDLPFYTMSGVIDTDEWPVTGNYPFLLKRGFTGKITHGTPIYQIIPFRRESWDSEQIDFSEESSFYINNKISEVKSIIEDGYKKIFWHKKNFN